MLSLIFLACGDNMNVITLAPGSNPNNKRQAVFVAFTCHYPIWSNKSSASVDIRYANIPMAAMMLRADSSFGFPGGKVEEGETLVEALIREVWEEVEIHIPGLGKEYVDALHAGPICSHEIDSIVTHLWHIELPHNLYRVLFCGINPIRQNEGCLVNVQLGHYALGNLMSNNLAPTVLEELDCLLPLVTNCGKEN